MAALTGAGFSLLPLGGDADGKAPLRSVKDVRLNLSQVHGPMSRRGSSMYGVRLDDLAVLDLDKDDPALVEALEARFGPAAVHVQTAPWPASVVLRSRRTSPEPQGRGPAGRCEVRAQGLCRGIGVCPARRSTLREMTKP
jgi:hypothetical protein